MTDRHVALLRGINVGGHRKVPMAELRTVLGELGLSDVATYIQSGNVVFSGGPDDPSAAEQLIADGIERHFGFSVRVVVRHATDLTRLLDRSAALIPVVDAETHDKRVMVGFLAATPTTAAAAAIDPDRSPGDIAVVEGDHVHVAYAVGAGTTKLTGDYLERTLGVAMTMRNLATVRRLADMA